jgi:Zn-dependent protease
MFLRAYTIATVWGIPIKLHISLLIRVAAFIYYFGWVHGVLLEIGLSLSILLHELGHCLYALKKGCRVREITLMCIGGAAQMEQIPRRPRDEIFMAAAGPAVSLLLCVVFIGVGTLPISLATTTAKGADFGVNVIFLLGLMNSTLVVFNLLPAFPMDGGRILRASLTPAFGRLRATSVAARVGQIMAICFGVIGFFGFDGWGKSWLLVAVAFFVYIAAGNEYRMVMAQECASSGGRPTIFGNSSDVLGHGDKVIVGPPPYESGRTDETDLRTS